MQQFKKLLAQLALFTTIATTLLISGFSFAGSTQTGEAQFSPEEITEFAKSVEKYAAAKNARAFIIARVGQPAENLPKGIEFTHTAVAIYSQITLEDGEVAFGYAIHNLYQNAGDADSSQLVVDYPTDFFWQVHQLKAGILIPTPELQQKLIELVARNDHAKFHNPKYSLIANPFNSKYQNCTEFTLDMINSAIYQTTDVAELKAASLAHFTPQPVQHSRFKLWLGRAFVDGVHLSDHKGKAKTATFSRIKTYLEENALLAHAISYQL
ncbi:hypothetical protein DS2_03135 [Catenovulum agarivorans DS-2]|uniref:DUF2145 domain-containing protein n=1 Tax=Catenovulum agarivorans DS-2 TaxID=1328313 RepID=W7QFT6_9ALTE|nr:DUF2145 domain-containing protein [Catenovulum agarivorans]EWH11784.1 hypothetical protein DS2_03135 [Catenovulum agarivorans DS-2]